MRQFVMIYTGLLLIGLASMILHGLVMVTVTSLFSDEIHVAGILSIENGLPAHGRIDTGADRGGWERDTFRESRVAPWRFDSHDERPCKFTFSASAPCDSI